MAKGDILEGITKRQDLMKLIEYGTLEKSISIMGNDVVMRVIDSDERELVLKATSGVDIFTQQELLKKATLAKALVSINSRPLPDEAHAMNFLGKLKTPVLERFWKEYDLMRQYQIMMVEEAEIAIKNSLRSQSPETSGDGASSQSPTGSETSTQSETKSAPSEQPGSPTT
jgi:hypothetical protein